MHARWQYDTRAIFVQYKHGTPAWDGACTSRTHLTAPKRELHLFERRLLQHRLQPPSRVVHELRDHPHEERSVAAHPSFRREQTNVTAELHGAEAVDLIQIQTRAIDAVEPLVNQQRVKLELEKKHELVDHLVVYPPKGQRMHARMDEKWSCTSACLFFVVVFLFIDGVHRVLGLGITVRVMDRGDCYAPILRACARVQR
jgi:hypothetical protein